jgi:hypothetical protein
MMYNLVAKITAPAIMAILIFAVAPGCTREKPSEKPPIHFNPNMDNQPKYKAQAQSEFFDDGATMRAPVAGSVSQGYLRGDGEYFDGKYADGSFIREAPVEVTVQLLNRGRERYDIYCSPCHSRVGDGKGIMISRGYIPPPSFHTDRIRKLRDGEIYNVITQGVRNMPPYANQINPDDRWAIVGYLRVLQRSHNATIEDIPIELRDKVK